MEFLAGQQATELVQDVLDKCSEDLVVIRPMADLAELEARLREALGRGVRVRTLHDHTLRTSGTMREYARAMTEHGAQVRTADLLANEVMVVDRRLLVLGDGPSRIVVISEPHLVTYFVSVFEYLWEQGWAFPAPPSRPAAAAGSTESDPKLAILRMLSEGAKDEQVARQLGLSLRTCRRHIARVMFNVGAVSRFQAGVLATRLGLLD